MPTTKENKTFVQRSADIQGMKNAAADTAYQGSQIEGQAYNLGDEVMNAVRADRQSRGVSKIAQDVGATSGQLVSDPEAIRSRTSATGLVAPSTVNQLTSNARALNLATLGEQSTQQSLNQGSLDEIIQAGANQLKARAATLYAQAQQEEAKANALMQQLQFEQSEAARAFSEMIQMEELNLAKSRGGGGTGGLKRTQQDINNDILDYTKRGKAITETFAGLGVLTEENKEDYAIDLATFGAAVESGDLTSSEAAKLLYEKYKPTGGFNVQPTEEEVNAELDKMPGVSRIKPVVREQYISPLLSAINSAYEKYMKGRNPSAKKAR